MTGKEGRRKGEREGGLEGGRKERSKERRAKDYRQVSLLNLDAKDSQHKQIKSNNV